MAPGEHDETACARISELLARVGDKWTVLVIRHLGAGPTRFNALKRQIGDISQKMLATTLRSLERDGFVTRSVTPTTPPQVEYALTDLGYSLLGPVCALARWTIENAERIEAARRAFAAREGAAQPLRTPAPHDLWRA
ncbi:helix-turn-helix domain-containing protein [Amaricoccus sp.]|uniref:winged helix-turn-helix transcriptional regulator n=1 Tax=Amaricoccus sp. TaxID=1872485 RepID=UPI001B3F0AE7|nr:helix-turn-helix domain-containing protein [Amaricoccus sp.]MBP7001169.1 helix-turn-helix transcriptional regulator [Amaricoccus sp.]